MSGIDTIRVPLAIIGQTTVVPSVKQQNKRHANNKYIYVVTDKKPKESGKTNRRVVLPFL